MKINQMFEQKKLVFSLEVFPPKKTSSIDLVYNALDQMAEIRPDFISVTFGAGGTGTDNLTCKIASHIKSTYQIEPLAHLTCVNSTREEVLANLGVLRDNNIENILALRGDINPAIPAKTDFRHADELVRLIRAAGDFNVVGACYPEGHSECESQTQDIKNLRYKVDAGVSHLITQLFFDNEEFFSFQEKARIADINIPIEAGIMPITSKRQIERVVAMCGASLPKKFVKMINRFQNNPDALMEAGISYATDQIIELVSQGAQGIHLYTMNNPQVACKIYDRIKNILQCENEA